MPCLTFTHRLSDGCDTGNLGFSILPEVTQLYRRIQRANHQPVWLVGDPLYLLSYSQSQTWVLKQYLAYIGLYLKTSVSEIPFKPHIYITSIATCRSNKSRKFDRCLETLFFGLCRVEICLLVPYFHWTPKWERRPHTRPLPCVVGALWSL